MHESVEFSIVQGAYDLISTTYFKSPHQEPLSPPCSTLWETDTAQVEVTGIRVRGAVRRDNRTINPTTTLRTESVRIDVGAVRRARGARTRPYDTSGWSPMAAGNFGA